MNRPNIDVFGHCIMCGKSLLENKYVDEKMQVVFKGDKEEVEYLLDDGSRMRVTMCRLCKDSLDGSESSYVMKSVIRGWQHEIETYSHWDQERKDRYMKKYGRLKVVVRSDNKNKDVLDNSLKAHKENKFKNAKEKGI